ncbi:hypothetical protein N480_14100 [Pseudoalteromonas luteoviolacea S2607]|uniref:hypothetical protein n=1 Tax=Pseudoalteromonas luteoviolacea TaxID=43657 RepID=UPI0007B09F68|nr:hypothetical protein [Pseudoalteromonas luteoviolacea]KZN37871.1 hypothetical protein N480_14100 [Pseudoalteromonas luteoviolacea S2607]
MRIIYSLLTVLFCANVNASVTASSYTKITAIESYSSYGDGDVIFQLENPESSCSGGYWMKKSTPGFEANLSMILASYHAQSKVQIRGFPGTLWGGSKSPYCHVYSIRTSL